MVEDLTFSSAPASGGDDAEVESQAGPLSFSSETPLFDQSLEVKKDYHPEKFTHPNWSDANLLSGEFEKLTFSSEQTTWKS